MARIPMYSMTPMELQEQANKAKDELITRLNKDYKLGLNAAEYVFVIHKRGWLGQAFYWVHKWARPKDYDDDDATYLELIRVRDPDPEPTQATTSLKDSASLSCTPPPS